MGLSTMWRSWRNMAMAIATAPMAAVFWTTRKILPSTILPVRVNSPLTMSIGL